MTALLGLSRLIDRLNERIGHILYWAVLAAVVVSAGNALVRYSINYSSNAWLEIQWYLFAAVFLLCSGYTFLKNEHIRIDVISSKLPRAALMWIDIIGTLVFMLPISLYIMWSGWHIFAMSWVSHEISGNAGGLILWPARLMVPVGFFLLSIQGVSEVIKRIAFLKGLIPDPLDRHHGSHGAPAPLGE